MRIIKKIIIVFAVLCLVIAAVGLIFFPSHIHVERSVVINQKQKVVFDYMNNLSNWNSWSPWYHMDPKAKFNYEGPSSGKGSALSWESEVKDVGKGKMTITESKPDSLIRQELNFMENGVANSYYRLNPQDAGTKVAWGFEFEAGANPLYRIMGGFMDGMVGKDFERGLANLKKNTEAIQVTDTVMVE